MTPLLFNEKCLILLCLKTRGQSIGHGWTRINTDKKGAWFFRCLSVFIGGQCGFLRVLTQAIFPINPKLRGGCRSSDSVDSAFAFDVVFSVSPCLGGEYCLAATRRSPETKLIDRKSV